MGLGKGNIFRDDYGRNLMRIFQPDSKKQTFDIPQILNPDVQLVHDFLSTIAYAAVSIWDNIGAADTISILQATPVPEGYIWIVDEVGLFTDDGTTRTMTLFLHYINAVGDFSVPVASQDSGAVASRWWPIGKRLIMPPGSKLELTVPALTAGKKIRYTAAYLQVPAGQFAPRG